MPEACYKIATFRRYDRHWSVSDPTYSWQQVLDIVQRFRDAKLDLADVLVLDAREDKPCRWLCDDADTG